LFFWNSGGYTKEKAHEFQNILVNRNIDPFCIVEADSSSATENEKKRATNWSKYKQEMETLLQDDVIDDNVDISSERINSIIIQAATKHIPRGKVKNYKPYWNTKLDPLVKEKK
jgi:hypothetical protein